MVEVEVEVTVVEVPLLAEVSARVTDLCEGEGGGGGGMPHASALVLGRPGWWFILLSES